MRMFGLIGLVLALLVVGLLAKKQMGGQTVALPAGAASSSVRAQGAQGEQVRQDFQRQLDQALQQPKTPSDDQ